MKKKSLFFLIIVPLLFPSLIKSQEIIEAVKKGDVEKVKLILEKNPQGASDKDEGGFTPLHHATNLSNLDIVRLLLTNNADVNAKDSRGRTPLYLASWKKQKKIADLLLKNGADIFSRTEWGNYPLYMSVSLGCDITELMADQILKQAVDEKIKSNVLHIITKGGFENVTRNMISEGVNIYSLNEDGGTLLHSAVIGNMTDLAGELLEKGFDINAKDKLKRTAFHYALIDNNPEIVKLLLERDANVNIPDIEGRIPLHIAEDWRNSNLINTLKQAGAKSKDRKIYELNKYLKSKSDVPLEILALGNCGFLFSYNDKKILIDVEGEGNTGFFEPTHPKTWQLINQHKPPFDGINHIFITHPHSDHIGFEEIAAYLEKNTHVRLFTTVATKDSLAIRISSDAENQINAVDLESGVILQKVVDGIKIQFYGLDHGSELKVLGFLFNIDDMKICFMTDVDLADLCGTGIENEEIDILLTSRWNLFYQENVELVKRYFNYRYLIAIHLAKLEYQLKLPQILENFPGVIFFRDRMEAKIFK